MFAPSLCNVNCRLSSPHALADLPKRPRPEGCRRRHAGRELSQRHRRAHQGGGFRLPAGPADRFTSRASSASATASIAPSTTRIRRASGFPIAPCTSPAKSFTTRTSTRSCGRWASASSPTTPGAIDRLGPDDVVILPAFGVTVAMLQQLERRGCTLIDTTCGSVLNVWKNVRRYCEGGYTSIIHGKAWHEETQATASQAVEYGGRYLVVLNHDGGADCLRLHPARRRPRGVPRALRHRRLGRLRPRPRSAAHRPRQPDDDADVRVAGDRRDAEGGDARPLRRRRLAAHFQAFDTICSATQDRQDAVVALLEEQPVDLMIVIGGYNSSNTCNLARICAASRPTFHIADPTAWSRRSRFAIGRSVGAPRSSRKDGCPKMGRFRSG